MTVDAPPAAAGTFEIATTPTGTTATFRGAIAPTQAAMEALLATHREALTALTITPPRPRELETLTFEYHVVGTLPALRSLRLRNVNISLLDLTAHNLPALEELEVAFSLDEIKSFNLSLPRLRRLQLSRLYFDFTVAKHDWAPSISRCPALEFVYMRAVRFLSGANYLLLPRCRHLVLLESVPLENLRIVYAPRLEQIDVTDAARLVELQLEHLPAATADDIVRLNSRGTGPKRQAALLDKIEARPWPADAVAEDAATQCSVLLGDADGLPLSFESLWQLQETGRIVYE